MHITDNELLMFSLVTILVLFCVGGYAGFGTGVTAAVIEPAEPVEGNFLTFAWDGVQFIWSLLTFSIAGMPVVLNMLIDIDILYPLLWLGLKFVRGTGG